KKEEEKRLVFYQSVVKKHISNIEEQLNISLDGVPVVMSGMASSTIGMMELPYKQIPLAVSIRDLHFEKIKRTEDFKQDMILISGIRTDTDIMRGEEVQLLGCDIETSDQRQVFIFPGTHSKHIIVENGQITGFQTYMTGEFFNLLSANSILSKSISMESAGKEFSQTAFEKGVSDSLHTNLLHQSFMVRTNDLFKRLTKNENYWYLSGLLIGTELIDLFQKQVSTITIVGENKITGLYQTACEVLNTKNVKSADVNDALIKAHILFAKEMGWK
ncbi:MAG TPA: 2-dehydro-3-deoxygalactonokinase, partial [Chitinophagaceae bacterium]|nr:2-dehydro-3-deoxygalactonokinase [Chitinophagaceae bacterium]